MPSLCHRTLRRLAIALLPILLAGCGGGGGSAVAPPASCSIADQKSWLAGYMDDWYFWYKISPKPDPAPYASVDDYFNALLYTGTDAAFPADRWSFTESTETFNRFYGDGQSLGYGVSVAGIEVTGRPDLPLFVRYVEPLSPAAGQVARGDQVLAMNGRSAADIIAADDYSALTAANAGETLTLQLRDAGGDRTVALTAGVFTLSPVATSAVVTSPAGRKMGYLVVENMISQALAPLETAFAQFKAAGASEIVLDLRYNGGGLVSVANTVASYVAGAPAAGRTFTTLLYNDRQSGHNASYPFAELASAAGVARVFVLTGPRTCSASEQVVNGLRGVGIDVVAIGDTTCGKPVGFLPTSQCGTTYNVVNFESVNERNEGRYFDGFAATCAVADELSQPLGSPAEALLAAARSFADSGQCPPAGSARATPLSRRKAGARSTEPGERQGMIVR